MTLTPDELRTLFLFESLTDEQLTYLSSHGTIESYPAGATVFAEAEPATKLVVLLSGSVELSRLMHGDDVRLNRTDQRGVYAGATQAFMGDRATQVNTATLRAVSAWTWLSTA